MLPAPKPDLSTLRRVLMREIEPPRVFHFEHGIAPNVQEALRARHQLSNTPTTDEHTPAQWDREAAIYRGLGFETFRVWLPGAEYAVGGSRGITWGEEHTGPIQSFENIDTYDWPDPAQIDTAQLEHYQRTLAGEMGVFHVVKLWEVVRELMGFEGFCFNSIEAPDLCEQVTRRVGEFHVALTRMLCEFDCVFAIYAVDDFGYKTSTMLDPDQIRQMFLPWHRRIAQIAHDAGKLLFFHSCGKVDALMDDLIDVVGIDAKHSFEDTIVPVTEAKQQWGDRVSLLGGIDVDFVARAEPSQIRQRVQQTLDVCQPGAGYCVGMGNWVTDYIPVANYEALLDAARAFHS